MRVLSWEESSHFFKEGKIYISVAPFFFSPRPITKQELMYATHNKKQYSTEKNISIWRRITHRSHKKNHKAQLSLITPGIWAYLSLKKFSQATLNAWLYNLLQGVLHKFIVFWLRRGELLNYKTFRNYSNHVLYIGLAGKLFWY